jgi:hypothetical protein
VAEKELERLKHNLDDVISSSIELEHEIVIMQAKLKEEKAAEDPSQSASSLSRCATVPVGQDAEESEVSHSNYDDIVAMEEFEKVWAMEDEEDIEEPKVVMPLHIAPTLIENSSIGHRSEGISEETDAIRTTDASFSTAPGSECDYRASSTFDEDIVCSLPVSPPNASTSISIYEDSLSTAATPESNVYSSQAPLESAPPPVIDKLPKSPASYDPSVFEDSTAKDYSGPMSDSSSSMGGSVHAPDAVVLSKPYATGSSDPSAARRGTGEIPPSSPGAGNDENVIGLTTHTCTTYDESSAAIDSSPEPDSHQGLNHSKASALSAYGFEKVSTPEAVHSENYDPTSSAYSSSDPLISPTLSESSDESYGNDDSNSLIQSKDLEGLNKAMESDDLPSIETKAARLAKTFKRRLSLSSNSQSDFLVDLSASQPATNKANDASTQSGDNAPEELIDNLIDVSKITVDQDSSYGNISSVYLDLSHGPTTSKRRPSVEDYGSNCTAPYATAPYASFDASSATQSQGDVATKSGSTFDDFGALLSHGSLDESSVSSATSSRQDSQIRSKDETIMPSAGESSAAEAMSYLTSIESIPATRDSPVGSRTQKAGEATQGDWRSVGRSASSSDDESIEIQAAHEPNGGGAVIKPESKAAKIARFRKRIAPSGVNRATDSGVDTTNNQSKLEATSSKEDHRQHQDSKAAKIARFRNRIAPAVAESSNRADAPQHENELPPGAPQQKSPDSKAEAPQQKSPDSKAEAPQQKSPDSKASKIARFRNRIGAPISEAPQYSKPAKLVASEDEHMQPNLEVSEDEYVKAIERGQEQSKLAQPKSPTNGTSSSSVMEDWSAVGVTASMLADWSDSQSCSSRTTDTASVSSMDATRQASMLDTPFANELDKLVESLDWEGVRLAAENFEPAQEEKTPHVEEKPLDMLEEKRLRKRELEAWRQSIKETIPKSS